MKRAGLNSFDGAELFAPARFARGGGKAPLGFAQRRGDGKVPPQ